MGERRSAMQCTHETAWIPTGKPRAGTHLGAHHFVVVDVDPIANGRLDERGVHAVPVVFRGTRAHLMQRISGRGQLLPAVLHGAGAHEAGIRAFLHERDG